MAALSDKLRVARDVTRNSVKVKFGDEEITLYAKPLTGMEIDKILARHKDFATKPTAAAMVDIIIMKAETESGEMAFDLGDKPVLLMRDINWLHSINNGLFPNVETDLSDDAIDAEVGN